MTESVFWKITLGGERRLKGKWLSCSSVVQGVGDCALGWHWYRANRRMWTFTDQKRQDWVVWV